MSRCYIRVMAASGKSRLWSATACDMALLTLGAALRGAADRLPSDHLDAAGAFSKFVPDAARDCGVEIEEVDALPVLNGEAFSCLIVAFSRHGARVAQQNFSIEYNDLDATMTWREFLAKHAADRIARILAGWEADFVANGRMRAA